MGHGREVGPFSQTTIAFYHLLKKYFIRKQSYRVQERRRKKEKEGEKEGESECRFVCCVLRDINASEQTTPPTW